MKRDHPQHPHLPHCQQQPPPGGTFPMDAKGKMMMMDDQLDAGEDELLAALGYKVRASSMADVAQKLEQLEMAMAMGGASSAGGVGVAAGGGALDDNAVLSHLASETVHYNPSDLSSWLENMLSELNVPPLPPPPPPPPPPLQPPLDVRGGRHEHHLPPPPPPPLPAVLPLIIDDPLAPAESSVTSVDFPSPSTKRVVDYDDLSAIIPGGLAAYGSSTESAADPDADTRDRKRIKSTASSTVPPPTSKTSASPPPPPPPSTTEGAPLPVVLVDSQETGIRLVHTLLACAEAVQQENRAAAEALVKQIGVLAMSQGGAMRKVSTYFAEALARRIYRIYPQQDPSLDSAFSDLLQMHFYEACPYLKFAHFTANQAILEAFAGKSRVHVIDFGMKQGMQWPALMQALALRPGGPPSFRLTGIGPPQPDNTDALQQVGYKLAQLAEEIHVEFEYRGYVANSLADLEPYMLQLGCRGGGSSVAASNSSSSNSTPSCNPSAAHEEEVVAVNSVFELHRLLGQQGAIEKVLGTVKAVRPSIVTVVEQEANHNGPVFLDRFTEALHYYSSMFDSLESGCGGNNSNGSAGGVGGDTRDQVMTEVYLGRQICNVVACEGAERTERHETTAQWRGRMGTAGFELVPLGSNAFKQASMLLELFAGGDGYRVEEKEGCLMLGWHTRPLITTSAWRLPSSPGGCAQRSGGRGNP